MKTRFWTIVILIVSYVIPMIAGFIATHNPLVFFGTVVMVINLFAYMCWYDTNADDDDVLMNSFILLVLGVIFAIIILLARVPELMFLLIAMLIVSLMMCVVFN